MVELIFSSLAIEEQPAELIAVFFFEDERPLRSEARLIDWLLGGMVSSRVRQGFMTGKLLEMTLIPSNERVKAEKILFVGLGKTRAFGYERVGKLAEKVVETCLGLHVYDLVLTFPNPQRFELEWVKLIEVMMDGIGDGLQTVNRPENIRVRFVGGPAYCDQIIKGVKTVKGSLRNPFPFKISREPAS